MKNQKGFTLLEALVTLVIMAIVVYGIFTAFLHLRQGQAQQQFVIALSQNRLYFQGLLLNDNIWLNTVNRNPSMSCLAANAQKNGGASNTISCAQKEQSFDLYSVTPSGAAAAPLIFSGTSGIQGLTKSGEICIYSADSGPSDPCVLKMSLTWVPICNTVVDPNCLAPNVQVNGRITGYKGPPMGSLNLNNYSWSIVRPMRVATSFSVCATSPTAAQMTACKLALVCTGTGWQCQNFIQNH